MKIHLARAFQWLQHHYDLRRRDWRSRIGEWVWRREHLLSKNLDNFNAKLASKYSGPYEIRRIISPMIVDLRSKHGKLLRHVHIQDLKTANKEDNEDRNIEDENNNDAEKKDN